MKMKQLFLLGAMLLVSNMQSIFAYYHKIENTDRYVAKVVFIYEHSSVPESSRNVSFKLDARKTKIVESSYPLVAISASVEDPRRASTLYTLDKPLQGNGSFVIQMRDDNSIVINQLRYQ